MPFSSGTFTLTSGNPVVTGTVISSTTMNNTLSDIATGLSTCVLKDGTQTMTANLPMATFKLTGLGAGSTAGDSVRYEQVLLLAGGTMTGNLLFTDATYDIGASGATRPRDLFLSRNAVIGGTLNVTGHPTLEGVTATGATGSGKLVFDTSPTLVTPVLGTPTSGTLTNCTGLPVAGISNFSQITNSIAGNVSLNNTGTFFDGPSIAQGTSGTWFASGTVCLNDTAGSGVYEIKLWDGTTVIASAHLAYGGGANQYVSCSLSGYIASPAGNIRISVKDTASTSGLILANASGSSKDSTVSAFRLA